MNQKKIISIVIGTLLIITAIILLTVARDKSEQNTNNRSENATNNSTEESEIKTGRNIILTQFGATFALPERFDVTDVKIIYKSTDRYEVAVVASKTLPEKLDKSNCWGGTLELGSFAEITRYKTEGDMKDLQKVGNYYYRVDEGPATERCYDKETFENYYSEDVVKAIRQTLSAQ